MNLRKCFLFLIFTIISQINLATTIDDPCGGPSALLNRVNRPSYADSACVVPFKESILETGYQYLWLRNSAGQLQNFPQAAFRVGLPANNEFVLLLPNYNHQSLPPRSGFSAPTIGIKHEIGYNENWLGSVETLIAPPSGSKGFGYKGLSAAFNGIVTYSFLPSWSLTFMLGFSSVTTSSSQGGQRFSSINPDVLLAYIYNSKIDFYGEIFGASHTGPGEGSGFNFDAGILYLLRPYLALDFEVGQRISGNFIGFNQYVGTGLSIGFS